MGLLSLLSIPGMDTGGLVLVGTAAALLLSRRVVAGIAARQRVEAAVRTHHLSRSALPDAEPAPAVVEPTWGERGLLIGVAGFWVTAAAVALGAAAAGWVDLGGWASWVAGGTAVDVAAESDGVSIDDDEKGGLMARLLGASKWAALAIGLKVSGTCLQSKR